MNVGELIAALEELPSDAPVAMVVDRVCGTPVEIRHDTKCEHDDVGRVFIDEEEHGW